MDIKDFVVSPYGRIQEVTNLGRPISKWIVCKGDLTVSTGKSFRTRNEAYAYSKGLIDGGWDGWVTIRFEYE